MDPTPIIVAIVWLGVAVPIALWGLYWTED